MRYYGVKLKENYRVENAGENRVVTLIIKKNILPTLL